MTNPEEAFAEVAHQARKFSRLKAAVLWAMVPLVLCVVLNARKIGSEKMLDGMILLFIPPLMLFFYGLFFVFGRVGASYKQLRAAITTEPAAVLQSVSPAGIGPLLEVALSDSVDREFLLGSTGLLVEVLKSVREDTPVLVTSHERSLLHKIVLHGWWDWEEFGRAGTRIGETEYRALRSPAVRALGVLGNSASIPVLKRFARKTDDPKLRESALQSIEQIRKRLQDGPEQMLRPSKAPDRPDTLLRPVLPEPSPHQDRQQLLRPNTTDTER